MKKFVCLLMLCASLISCNKEETPGIPKFAYNDLYILAGTSEYSIDFIPNSSEQYDIISLDPEVATATLRDNNVVAIETIDFGDATIRAVNRKNNNIYCDLRITSLPLQGSVIEISPYTVSAEVNGVELTGTIDEEMSDILDDVFIDYFTGRLYYTYIFSEDAVTVSKNWISVPTGAISIETFEGTFSWNKKTQKLVLNYNNTSEEFTMEHQAPGSLLLIKDFTQQFQDLYPEIGFTKVSLKAKTDYDFYPME